MAQPDLWIQQFDLCIQSFTDFQAQYPLIKQHISSFDSQYRTFFFTRMSSIILHAKELTPTSRFIAVYLILLLSEEVGKSFADHLAKEEGLLDYFYQAAQHESSKNIAYDERGRFFFSKSPSLAESRIGTNFIRLCIESLIFWGETFGGWNPKDPCHSFLLYNSTMKKKFKKMTYYHFIYKKYDLSQNLATWNFHDSLPKVIQNLEPVSKPKAVKFEDDEEEEWEIEELNKFDSQPQEAKEDQQFANFLRKVTRRNLNIDLNDEVEESDSLSNEKQVNSEEKIRDKSQKKLLNEEPNSLKVHELDQEVHLNPKFSNCPTQSASSEKPSIEDLKDEEIDENKSVISVSYKEALPGSTLNECSATKKPQTKSVANVWPSISEEISLRNLPADAKVMILGKEKEEKIFGELSEIQRSIQKSKNILGNPVQPLLKKQEAVSFNTIPSRRVVSDENPPSFSSIEPQKFIRSTQKRLTSTTQQTRDQQTQAYSFNCRGIEETIPKLEYAFSAPSISAKNLPGSKSGLDLNNQNTYGKKVDELNKQRINTQLETNEQLSKYSPMSKKSHDPFNKHYHEKINQTHFTPKHIEKIISTPSGSTMTPSTGKNSDHNGFQAFTFTPSSETSKQSGSSSFLSKVSNKREENRKVETSPIKFESPEERIVFMPFLICKNKKIFEGPRVV